MKSVNTQSHTHDGVCEKCNVVECVEFFLHSLFYWATVVVEGRKNCADDKRRKKYSTITTLLKNTICGEEYKTGIQKRNGI